MKVIFACVHNAGRSQKAAAFFNQFADSAEAQAISAGTQPANQVHPWLATVVGVLIEVPVILSVVKIVNSSKAWYEGDIVKHQRQEG